MVIGFSILCFLLLHLLLFLPFTNELHRLLVVLTVVPLVFRSYLRFVPLVQHLKKNLSHPNMGEELPLLHLEVSLPLPDLKFLFMKRNLEEKRFFVLDLCSKSNEKHVILSKSKWGFSTVAIDEEMDGGWR